MNLTTYQLGALKGTIATSIIFLLSTGIGLYFLHRKHEEALNKTESETARFCLDMAAEHYEGVILRREKAAAKAHAQNPEALSADTDTFQKEINAVNNYEVPDEEWVAMRKEIDRYIKEYEAVAQQVAQKDTECKKELERLRSIIYAAHDPMVGNQSNEEPPGEEAN